MKIFKLAPTGNGAGDWARSAYCGETIIRATNERDARAIAAFSFALAKEVKPGESVTVGPWRDIASVRCAEFSSPDFDASGPRGVVVPAEWAQKVPFGPQP